jgi:peptidoglycan/LPS O-acetylase OafA/YrhL
MTNSRLAELDALRRLAAFAVVLFHYSTRYDVLFGHPSPLAVSFHFGCYGVQLIFIISGFVIYMTLERFKPPLDFVVSRGARVERRT